MIVVIDAYNVLKSGGEHGFIEEKDQERFLRLLGKYAKRKELDLLVVFDGGHYIHPFRCVRHGVVVVYSGMKESADAYIKKYVRQNRNKDLLLVSSDRELGLFAGEFGIMSLNAVEFYELVRAEMVQKVSASCSAPAIKMNESVQSEIDELMYASKPPRMKTEDMPYAPVQDKSKNHGLSKTERAMMKKIKKL